MITLFTKRAQIVFLLLVLSFSAQSAFAKHIDLPQDKNGWAVFTPTAPPDAYASRIMYVSANGNDNTGQVYNSTSFADPFNPNGEQAFATYAAAYAHVRNGYPDWILFKRGETFKENICGTAPTSWRPLWGGKDENEPALLSAYGTSGASPVIKTDKNAYGLWISPATNYIAVSGLDFYSYTRNPKDPGYVDSTNVPSIRFLSGGSFVFTGLLIEGCKFRFYHEADIQCLSGNYASGARLSDITIRRCLFLDNYSGSGGHGQGLFAQLLTDFILEENIFDHNGWYSQANSGGVGEATIFNHDLYAEQLVSAIIRKNIFLRASSIGTKFAAYSETPKCSSLIINDNLYVDDEVGISIWGDYKYPKSYENLTITNNVLSNLGRSLQTVRNLSWGMEIADVDAAIISNNLIVHQEQSGLAGFGMRFKGYFEDATISQNIIDGLLNSEGLVLYEDGNNPNHAARITFSENKIQIPSSAKYTISTDYDPSGEWTFSGNTYYSNLNDGKRFDNGGTAQTNEKWASTTGDNFSWTQSTFPDSNRDVDTYMGHIGGTATVDGFIAAERAQDRYNWDSRLKAETVDAWIRAGYYENPTLVNPIQNSKFTVPAHLTFPDN